MFATPKLLDELNARGGEVDGCSGTETNYLYRLMASQLL